MLIPFLSVLGCILVGAVLQRLGRIDESFVRGAGRVVVDVAMPAMAFVRLLETATQADLIREWPLIAVGAGLILGGFGLGALGERVYGGGNTGIFVAGLPNWVFLPLAFAPAIGGDGAVRTILFVNIGATAALWTAGVVIVRGRPDATAILNPGLLASIAAVVALLLPVGAVPNPYGVLGAGWTVLSWLGSVAIPLSMLVTGATVAAAPIRLPGRAVLGVSAVRLLITPLIVIAGLFAAHRLQLGLPALSAWTVVWISAMPVAVSAGAFAERFGGDRELASEAVVWTTLLAIGTLPLCVWIAGAV